MSTPVPTLLKEIHRLRKFLRDLQSEIDLGPRVAKIRQQTLAAAEQTHKDAYDAIKKLKLKQKDDEGTLKQTETRLEKLAFELNGASSKKEFDAKQTEIANATTKKGELEDAILTAITEIEERTANLPAVEKAWADAQAAFAEGQTEAKARLERMLAEQTQAKAELASVEANLPADMRTQYDRLVKAYGPDGFAGVNGRACSQCRTSITEGAKSELARGAFTCCANCGRALYVAD